MRKHNCIHCGNKLTCKNKDSMQKLIDMHNERCRGLHKEEFKRRQL